MGVFALVAMVLLLTGHAPPAVIVACLVVPGGRRVLRCMREVLPTFSLSHSRTAWPRGTVRVERHAQKELQRQLGWVVYTAGEAGTVMRCSGARLCVKCGVVCERAREIHGVASFRRVNVVHFPTYSPMARDGHTGWRNVCQFCKSVAVLECPEDSNLPGWTPGL